MQCWYFIIYGNVLFNNALNTFYLRLYGIKHMVKDHSDIEETHCCHMGYSFWLTARFLLYASSYRQNDTYHSHGSLAGTGIHSMGPPWRNDPTTHCTMSERSYHGATSRSLHHIHSYLLKLVTSWCYGSLNKSLMVDPLSYILFQSVLHNW